MKFFNDNDYAVKVRSLGIDDCFVEHGTPAELYALCGYDERGIAEAAKNLL